VPLQNYEYQKHTRSNSNFQKQRKELKTQIEKYLLGLLNLISTKATTQVISYLKSSQKCTRILILSLKNDLKKMQQKLSSWPVIEPDRDHR
jgi:hypothetical protein